MGTAKCSSGDKRLGQELVSATFFSTVRKPAHGYFCVVKDAIFVALTISFPADTPPFDIEVWQQQDNGKDELIRSYTVKPKDGRFATTAFFTVEGSQIANTRCFLIFRGDGTSEIMINGTVSSS